ncbi:sodium- and chloride-dependent glycine transporter 1-like [Tigriopus californicus]|nr:sodium- and chloride-dependent glycine transporter 1-like [Tigriopus californicus]
MGKGEGAKESKDVKAAESGQNLAAGDDERGTWDNQCDFFLSCLGYAVGLGNVWRFPYLCYEHGGGSFLVAYSLMLLLAGLPLFFMELSIGQYSGLGPTRIFGKLAPAFKGLGYGMLFVTMLVAIYYNMIIAWTLYYTFAGFTSSLPWEFCGNDHNTLTCYQKDQADECNVAGDGFISFYNNTCTPVSDICSSYNMTHVPDQFDQFNYTMCNNGTMDLPLNKVYPRRSASEDYFTRVMLGLDETITWSNYGGLKWDLVLCLLGAWVIVCLCLIKGVQSSGKVVYFTALFPYFVLLCLLIRGALLPGAADGVVFYLQPHLHKLASVKIWSDAATQIFYSLGPSFGGLITLASYNKFSNNCHRDAILIAFCNCATSVFAGFVIFSIIGFMAHESGQPISEVIASGPGLAFVAYPEAVTKFPLSPAWSFLFFLMLLTLGLDSQFTMTETLTTALMDQWPQLRPMKGKVVIGASVVGFILGVPLCCPGGIYMFTLIDSFSASWSLLVLALAEVILIIYVYGVHNFLNNIKEMGIRIPKFLELYWRINWQVFTPVVLFFITIVTWITFKPCQYNGYVFPPLIQTLGWLMACTSIIIAVALSVYEVYTRKNKGKITSNREMLQPTLNWGPAIKKIQPVQNTNNLSEATYNNEGFSS